MVNSWGIYSQNTKASFDQALKPIKLLPNEFEDQRGHEISDTRLKDVLGFV